MRESHTTALTNPQRRDVVLVLSLGCDRETAAKYVGASLEALRAEMARSAAFANEVRRAEAGCEMKHMQNVQNAARDERHWRASVWWLERRAPERYGRRAAGTVTARHLENFLTLLISTVIDEVHSDDDRQRLLERLEQLADSLAHWSSHDVSAEPGPTSHSNDADEPNDPEDDSEWS